MILRRQNKNSFVKHPYNVRYRGTRALIEQGADDHVGSLRDNQDAFDATLGPLDDPAVLLPETGQHASDGSLPDAVLWSQSSLSFDEHMTVLTQDAYRTGNHHVFPFFDLQLQRAHKHLGRFRRSNAHAVQYDPRFRNALEIRRVGKLGEWRKVV